jgi:hypothetical protein
MFNPDFYPTPPEVAARVARIKGLVLPEKLRRKSTRKTKR